METAHRASFMSHLFLDTNILVDAISNREPYSAWAYAVLQEAELGTSMLYTTATSVSTCWYVLRLNGSRSEHRMAISKLLTLVRVIPISHEAFQNALEATEFNDVEDAAQYFAALEFSLIDAIITRNVKDFIPSKIRVCTAEEWIRWKG